MLKAFALSNGRLIQVGVDSIDDLARKEIMWIDLEDPTEHERDLVRSVFRLELPDDDELKDLEASARYYQDEYGIHIRSTFLQSSAQSASNVTLSFTLHEGRVLTVHDQDLAFLRLFRMRSRAMAGMVDDAIDIVVWCYALAVEQDADVLEEIYKVLDEVSTLVLNRNEDITDQVMRDNLERIAGQEDLNGKVRLDLMDNRRALSFLLRSRTLAPAQDQDVREALRDIESLNGHTAFLFDKINFLMDALLGMITLAQNKIIKIFSIAAVVFLPPTLVASMYGMNFEFMPELRWAWGYPMAILLMITAGIAPYWYFKRKGWLG